jgi:hypothetical protein
MIISSALRYLNLTHFYMNAIISLLCGILQDTLLYRGTRWRSWLKHCATSRNVAGSIPNAVTGIFHLHNPSGRTMG